MSARLADRVRFARALRSRPFALLWAGQTVSALGDGAFYIALAWQVLLLTGSATAMGEVLIAQSIPRLIFLLVGGVVADRLPRRLILLWSDGGRALVVLVIAALGGLHVLQFAHLIGLSVLFGVAGAFFFPAYQSLPPQLVEAEDLTSANALVGLGRQLSTLVGPALGAGFVALAGPASAFAFDGITFVVSALCLAVMRVPVAVGAKGPEARTPVDSPSQAPGRGVLGMLADVPAGFAYVMRYPWLWITIAIASLGNVFWSTLQVSLPKLVHDVYGVGVWLLGAMLSADAIGALIVTLVVGQRRRLRHRGIIAYLAIALASTALLSLGLPHPHAIAPQLAVAAGLVIGVGLGGFDIVWITSLQELVPPDTLGRVVSIDFLGSFALQPVGLAAVGILTDRFGPTWVFIGAGGLNVALCALALMVRGIRNLD
jgi:MFS family permease